MGIEWGFGIGVGKACGEEVWGKMESWDSRWGIVNGYRGRFCLRWVDCGDFGFRSWGRGRDLLGVDRIGLYKRKKGR